MSDEPQSGKPANSVNEETIAIVRHLLNTDQRIMLHKLQHNKVMELTRTNQRNIHTAYHFQPFRPSTQDKSEHTMGASPCCQLTQTYWNKCMATTINLLGHYHREGETLLNRLVTSDERIFSVNMFDISGAISQYDVCETLPQEEVTRGWQEGTQAEKKLCTCLR